MTHCNARSESQNSPELEEKTEGEGGGASLQVISIHIVLIQVSEIKGLARNEGVSYLMTIKPL